ncbi:MAG: hypothetical protein ACHQ6T_17370 [Myxococcota bacterium]
MKRALLAAACLLACSKPEPPPYGFAAFPEQRFRFEADEKTDVDGTPVAIARAADVVLRAKPGAHGDTELELYLDRYYMSVDGGPGGKSELSISEEGLTARTGDGPVRLRADEKTPGGDTVLEMRARPVASVGLDARGAATAGIWTSPHPVLMGVSLLDWMLLALPTRAAARGQPWISTRVLPQIGQYALGLDVPVRWEEREGPLLLRGSAAVARDSLRVAENFEGRVSIETRGEADLEPDGRVREARLQLALDFAATNGTHVQSSHTVRLRCTSCEAGINSPQPGSDSGGDRDGIPQQGHVDDLPDHGGVRRGL